MSEQLIQNPEHVRNLWQKARPAADRGDAAREREAHRLQVKAAIEDGTYDATGDKYDTAYARMEARATEEVTEAARIEWDRKNTADPFE